MKIKAAVVLSTLALFGAGSLILPQSATAGNMFNNMMNPSKWFGKNNNRYNDYYDDDYYGGPPPGYGAPPPGYGYGAPGYGYGAPAYGYGAPAYGYGAPAQGYGAPAYGAPAAPAPAPTDNAAEKIRALEDRIRQLEAGQKAPAPAYGGKPYQPIPSQEGGAPPASSYPMPATGNFTPPPGSAFRPTN